MLTDSTAHDFLTTFRVLYQLQQAEPTKARAAVLKDLNRRWQNYNGVDSDDLIETAIGGGREFGGASLDLSKLSTRAANILHSARISTVEQLSAITDADLLEVKQCGPKVVEEIREKLG